MKQLLCKLFLPMSAGMMLIREITENDTLDRFDFMNMTLEQFIESVQVRYEDIKQAGYGLKDAVADVIREPVYRIKTPT